MLSGLRLGNDDRLTVSEILSLTRLQGTRLVMLSGCDTGVNDVFESVNDFVGLPAAFLQLGAAGVVSTLWPVNDSPTSLLVARFYELHILRKMEPPAALKGAQTWLRDANRAELSAYWKQINGGQTAEFAWPNNTLDRPFSHPHFWAGFVLYGK